MTKKNYDLIDLVKLIGSILIFALHADAMSSLGSGAQFYGVQLLARWGVPFYFITSAFFLFQKSENGNISKEKLINYVKRIALLYLVWFIFNLPFIGYFKLFVKGVTSINTWLVFFKNILVSSSFMGSWYLLSSIFSAWFVYMLAKKLSTKKILVITFFIYLLCILTSAYAGIFPDSVISFINNTLCAPYNSFLCGCFFFAVGKYMVEERDRLSKINPSACLSFAAVFLVLYYAEIIALKHTGILGATDSAFMLIPLSFFTVLLCVNTSCSIKNTKHIRKISTVVYCSQGTIILAASLVGKVLHNMNSLFLFAVACLGMAACIFVVLLLQSKTEIKWVQYLT